MFVKERLSFLILLSCVMLIQSRPQGETSVQNTAKPEPVSAINIIKF